MTEVEKETVQTDFGEIFDYAENDSESPSLLNPPPIPHDTGAMAAVNGAERLRDASSSTVTQAICAQIDPSFPPMVVKVAKWFGTTPDKIFEQSLQECISVPFNVGIHLMEENSEWQFWDRNYQEVPIIVHCDWDYHIGNWAYGRSIVSLGADKPKFRFTWGNNPSFDANFWYGLGVTWDSLRNERNSTSVGFGFGTNLHYSYEGGCTLDTTGIQAMIQRNQNRNMIHGITIGVDMNRVFWFSAIINVR